MKKRIIAFFLVCITVLFGVPVSPAAAADADQDSYVVTLYNERTGFLRARPMKSYRQRTDIFGSAAMEA